MKVTFKKISKFEGMEGICYSADLYVDNIKVGHILDDAWGGDYIYTDFSRNTKKKKKYTEEYLNAFVKTKNFTDKEITNDRSYPELNYIDAYLNQFQTINGLMKFWKRVFKGKTLDYTNNYCLIEGISEQNMSEAIVHLKTDLEKGKEKIENDLKSKKVTFFIFNSFDDLEKSINYQE